MGASKTNATIQDRSAADALTCPGGTFLQAVAPSGAPTCEAAADDSGSVRSVYGFPGNDPVFLEVDGVRVIGTCGNTLAALQFGTLDGPARIVDQTRDLMTTLEDGHSVRLGAAASGERVHTVLHVAHGPNFSKHTTFIATVARGAGCPSEFWGTALTGE